jgi:hypothetical protein
MNHKFESNSLQNDAYIIICILGESIPKGIIVYYPLVSLLNKTFSERCFFDSFLFFSLLKKFKLLYSLFFNGPSGPVGPSAQAEALEACFLGPLTGPVGPLNLSTIDNCSQEKLSEAQIQNRRNFVAEYYRRNPRRWCCHFFAVECGKVKFKKTEGINNYAG